MWSHWVLKKFEALKLAENLKALLIYDVFMGQTTGAVSRLLEDDQTFVQRVTNNHISLFQLFDVSVNKELFIEDWHTSIRVFEPHDVRRCYWLNWNICILDGLWSITNEMQPSTMHSEKKLLIRKDFGSFQRSRRNH